MDKRRSDTLSDLRRQRVRIRRIGIGAMLVGGLFALMSCDELTRRDAAAASPMTPQSTTAARGS
jgi:hypothetical protein